MSRNINNLLKTFQYKSTLSKKIETFLFKKKERKKVCLSKILICENYFRYLPKTFNTIFYSNHFVILKFNLPQFNRFHILLYYY